jgi:hypothetical protein
MAAMYFLHGKRDILLYLVCLSAGIGPDIGGAFNTSTFLQGFAANAENQWKRNQAGDGDRA